MIHNSKQGKDFKNPGKNLKSKFLILSFSFTFLFFSFRFSCYASSVRQELNTGNKLYQMGKLDEALKMYNEASIALPDSDIINFNIGAALYKKGDYQKAQEAFSKALTTDNKKLEADALYNIGNCKYRLGKLKENTDLSSTIGLLRESLDYYKRAVELDQKNTDARFNHEFVERELKVLLDKLKNEQQKERQNQAPSSKSEESGGSGEKKQAGSQEGMSEPAQAQPQKEEKKEGTQTESKQKETGQKQEEEQPALEGLKEESEGKELSEEQARLLLERYGKDEAIPDYRTDRPKAYDTEVLKDW